MPNSPSVAVRSLRNRLGAFRRRSSVEQAKPTASQRVARAAFETLENRQMLSVSMNNGWTEVTPPPGAKVLYVSSSQGSDSNNGLSASSPLKSIAKAKKLMRSGTGDQMLLKRGDTFREIIGFWNIDGKDANNPAVIGAYGFGARPQIYSGNQTAMYMAFDGLSNVAVIGLHFTGAGRGGAIPDGIVSSGKTSNFLIEDCKIEKYRNNVSFEDHFGKVYNLKIRRSIIVDAYSRSTHSQGLYADGVHGLLLEENIFDHNGWGNGAGQTMFNHNAYVTAVSSGLVARGNVFANASSHGLQARPGGTIVNNAFINNGVGLSFGLVNGDGTVTPGGVTGTVANNVFMDGHNIGGKPAGVGIEVSNVRSGSISDNLFVTGDKTTPNPAISLTAIRGTTNRAAAVGVHNLSISNNVIYNWMQGLRINSGFSISNLQVRNNDFQALRHFQAVTSTQGTNGQSWSGNRYNVPRNSRSPIMIGNKGMSIAQWRSKDSGAQEVKVNYPDAGRTVGRYAGDFLSRARGMSRANWDTRYTANPLVGYLKGGFRGGNTSVPPVGNTPPPAPQPAPAPQKPTSPASPPSNSGPVSVSINDVSVTEGDYGTKNVTLTISLSGKSSKPVAVKWETKGQTALVGRDYVGRNGTVYFKAGETTKTITVAVKGDRLKEKTETFVVNLKSATNATFADRQGQISVYDNESGASAPAAGPVTGTPRTSTGKPSVRISDGSVLEGDIGARNVSVTVTLSQSSSSKVAVRWETKGQTAVVGRDYVGRNGTLVFNPGETSKTITVQVKGDKLRESNEVFSVNLLGATNATFADAQGRITVINDD